MAVMAAGWSRVEEGQGTVRPAICAAGVPAAEMACGVDPGTSVLEGSKVLADICGALGGGSGDNVGEAEAVLGAMLVAEAAAAPLGAPGRTVMAIARAPALALALALALTCVAGITGEGRNGKAVVVLLAVVIGRGVKTNIN
jgi:hypothetical protein